MCVNIKLISINEKNVSSSRNSLINDKNAINRNIFHSKI